MPLNGGSGYYAETRSLNPLTGDLYFTEPRWIAGSPLAEIAVRVVRTPKGRYLPDPTFGVDYSVLKKRNNNTAAAFTAALKDAFDRYVKRGIMRDLKVSVTEMKKYFVFRIAFIDTRTGQQISIPPLEQPGFSI